MNIVILTSKNHFYANIIIKKLLESFSNQINLIIEDDSLVPGKSKSNGLKIYLKKSGFYYVFFQTLKQMIFQFLFIKNKILNNRNHNFISYKNIINERISILNWNILDKTELIQKIEDKKPDFILSIYFKPYINQKIIGSAKICCLNLHPALLPKYRGVSPIFWALANGENHVGVSLHKVAKDIDQGEILLQDKISVSLNDTEHSLYLKCSHVGANILIKFIKNFENIINNPIKQDNVKATYFSIPTKEMVYKFRKSNKKFFNLSEIL